MSDHRIKVDVELDTSKAKKQLDDLTKQKQKVEIDVDASKLKEASKEIEDIGKRKQQKIQLDVNTSELDEAVKKINHLKQGKIHIKANVDGTKAVDNMAKSYDTAKKSAQGLGTSIKELAKLGLSFQTIEQSARAAVEAISDIYNATLDLQMATGDSYSEVRNMVSGYNDMAKSLGAITTEVTSGADTWLRSGKSLAETNMLIKDTMVLSKNAKMTSEDSSKVLTATLNGFQLAADQASHVNDILSSIDMSSSSDAGGIGTALTKTASMAHNAGLSLEKTAASIATIKEVTQDSDESIGNALKSMLSRMNQIKAGKFIDAETGEALNDTEKVLKAVGINMRDVNGQFLDAETIIDNVGKKWLMFDRNTQKAIATAMGGTYQYNKLISLFDNYNKVLSLTETAQNSNGVALQKFNDAYLNSLEAKKKSLQASFESLSVNLISKESISGIMEATQSVIEFLDHTNLLKTALTGLAVGGAIKGFTMLTTSITQAAMKMQNFSSAMSLLKTGNIGTDGVKQLTTLVDGLSQSQLKAVLSSQNLTNAQRMQILQSTGLSKAQAAAKLSTMGLATAEGAATATTVTFSGALKGLWATLMTNPIVLITTALTAGISIWNAYQQSVEETIQTAKDASNAWKESTSSLDEQISKYKELKAKLASGDLSEAEEYNVKQQILEIQNQITSQYPEQAAGVDLVNGNLQTQLGLLQQIAVENAKSTLNENRKEFHDVEKAMTKKRHYSLGDTGVTNEIEGVGKDIYDIAKEFEKQGIVLQDTGMNTGIFTISFDGDASKADQVINDFMNRVSTLQSEYEGQDFATEQIESVLNYSGKALSANKEILDDYQESYQTFLQMDMVANEKLFSVDYDKSKKSYGQLYEDYADAVEKYNEALSSGDTSKIEEAKTSFEGVQKAVDSVVGSDNKYTSVFEGVTDQLAKASIAANEFKKVLGKDGTDEVLKGFESSAKTYANNIKRLGLSDLDFQIALDTEGSQKGEVAIQALTQAALDMGLIAGTSSEEVRPLLDVLVELGVISTQTGDNVEESAKSFEELANSTQTTLKTISAVSEALEGQSTGKSIDVETFNSEELREYQSALEYVNGTMRLNEERVAEITQAKAEEAVATNNANKAQKQSEYLKNAGEIEQLREKLKSLNEGTDAYTQTKSELDSLMSANSAIAAECQQYDLLTSAIKEATGAYQNWLDKQDTTESGDMFDASLDAMQAISDVADPNSEDYGRVGTKRYEAAVDFIVPESINHEDEQAVQNYMNSIGEYFNYDENAQRVGMDVAQFCSNAVNAGLMNVETDVNGKAIFNLADGIKMEDFEEKLNLSKSMVQAMFGEMEEFGGKFDWTDEAIQTVGDLGVKAYESANALQSLKENENLDIKMDVSGIEDIEGKITTLDSTIAQMNEIKARPDVDASSIENANNIIQYCIAQKQQLTNPVVMNIDTSQVEGEMATVLAKLQEFQTAKNELDMQASVGADTSEAQAKVNSLASEIQAMQPTIQAKVSGSFDASSIESIVASIGTITPEMLVKCGVNDTAIQNYTPENKDATVTYHLNSTAVDNYNPSNLQRTVTYNVITNGSAPKVNGTAHVDGTVNLKARAGHAFSQGDWGIKKDEVALVGELGNELLVRGGKFTTIGDNGAEFVNLKRGDIIFNHLQTRDLLSKGYVNSRAKVFMGGAYASGTAFANGGFLPNPGNNYQYNGTNSSASNNLNSASNNLSKAASDTSKAAEKLSEAVSGYTDWVDVLFKRLESQYDLLMSQMERIAHLPHKQEKLYEAMSKNSELMSKTQQAIGTYQSHFDSIVQQSGINPLIVHQIQNGSMDISKYDQDTQKIISEAQSWYDKLVDCNKQYDDLLNKQSELTKKALENIEDYIDMMTGIESSAVDYQEALRELAAAKGESAYSDKMYGSLKESIKNQQDVAGKLQSQVRLYQDEINKLMENGSMAKWSTEWYEAQAALNGFKEEAAEAEKTLIELQDQLRELDLLKLQQVIDELDRTAKRLENNTDLTESKGEQIFEKDLQAQLDNANAQIQANYNKRQELLRDQAKYDVGSEKYNEIAEEIEKLDDSIYDAMENIEDLKNKIWEVRWQPFFDGQEALGDLIDQTDDLRGLLNSDAFVGKNGGLTLDGIANIALINQGMIAAKQQIKNYNEALKKLDEDLKNGNISTSEYKEQQKEFLDQIATSTGVVQDYKNSIVDLYKQQLEAENDMAQKSIDKYSELLDIKKKNAEYSKNLRKQTKDINVLKTQIAALDSVNNEAAKAEKKRLEAQLADAESQLEDTRRDHEYDVRKNGYEGLSDDLNKELEDTLNDITYNSEKQEQVISNMLGKIVGMYDKAYDKIQQIINSTGFVPNGSLSNNIGSLGTSSGAQNQFNNGITTAPNYRPDDFTNVNTGQIQNGTTQNKNDQIQGEISKKPDLSNRSVAEITLSPLTLSIQEGSTANISATIRPNDAKNKSLQWVSSNPDVATVANGTVHAVKAGSTTISAIATDGGGATSSNSCAVTVTPKPEPPKPTPPQNKPNTGGGDGVPNVGDKVIFASGDYYYSSDGQSPAGNEMRGQEVYITSVNNASWAQRKIHISRTPRFGERDLGWVSLDQLKGYASGTKKIANAEEVARVNEGNKRELLIRYGSATGNAAVFHYGDSVVKADLANNIVELAKNKDDIFQTLNRTNNSTTNPTIINNHNHYDNMINVQGSIDKETYPGMKKVIEGVTKEFTKEAHRMGMHRTL